MFKKISDFINYFKYLENPNDALKFKFGITKTCNLEIKNSDYILTLHNVTSINKLMNYMPIILPNKLDDFIKYIEDIDRDKEYLVIDGINFINIYNTNFIKNNKNEFITHLEELYTDDEWNIINFEGRHVVDVGGNVGDTALYFASKGAEVISFEPVKQLYELAKNNVELNKKYLDKITLVNKGIGGKRGFLTFESRSVQGYANEESYEMEIISPEDLLNNYKFTPDILKMDCEGCEFEIILNNDLTMFNEIIFEHHAKIAGKDYKPLIHKLESDGFKINTYPLTASPFKFKDIGIIHAFK